jgi:hypothetical protein
VRKAPASIQEVSEVLKKVLYQATLNRIPKNPCHRDIILAIVCLKMQRRYAYTEIEFNDYLKHELERFNARVDHVTCRRYSVDCGFVKRDRGGNRYILNYPKLEAELADEVISSAGELIESSLQLSRERQSRKRTPPIEDLKED